MIWIGISLTEASAFRKSFLTIAIKAICIFVAIQRLRVCKIIGFVPSRPHEIYRSVKAPRKPSCALKAAANPPPCHRGSVKKPHKIFVPVLAALVRSGVTRRAPSSGIRKYALQLAFREIRPKISKNCILAASSPLPSWPSSKGLEAYFRLVLSKTPNLTAPSTPRELPSCPRTFSCRQTYSMEKTPRLIQLLSSSSIIHLKTHF
ncbi:UNVERIFIED_CONTAM: hypothetical protein GTU68_049573 [Idotea baltica]|nr:hypothetical protein [Idotea baltica]